MENLYFSLQATLPIFLVIAMGQLLGRKGFITKEFCAVADKLVFRLALPVKLFLDMAQLDLKSDLDLTFVGYCFFVSLAAILGIWAGARLFLKDKTLVGEFVQGAYRSSAAILGIALVENIYGNSGMVPMMILGSVPLYNIFAVVILTLESPTQKEKALSPGQLVVRVFQNPILIGLLAGTAYSLLPFGIPPIAGKTLSYLGGLASPLALLSIGAAFEGAKALAKLGPTLGAAFLKLVGLCGIFLPLAIRLGFRDSALVAILIMLGSPLTPSGYVMAKNMGHEGSLTASVVAVTTLLSAVTVTGWLFLCRSLGLVG